MQRLPTGARSTKDRTGHVCSGTVISPLSPCGTARGSSPSKSGTWGDWGKSSMPSKSIRTIANAPWGRKRYLLPLPILSVLLLGTALASPGLLRMTVNVFDDPNLTILASVKNVVHPTGPDGKLVGLMTVTNHASTDTQITVGTATIQSLTDGSPDGRITAAIAFKVPLVVPAGATVKVPFSGVFTGSVLDLHFGDSFLVTPTVTWFSVPASGPAQGPYTYAQAKTCTISGTPLPSSVWTTTTACA